MKSQAIVVDDATNRVLFAVESAGEYEETIVEHFGILLMYGMFVGEAGRSLEDAYRASFNGLAREVRVRLGGDVRR